jgi:hypothetical protein
MPHSVLIRCWKKKQHAMIAMPAHGLGVIEDWRLSYATPAQAAFYMV